MWLKHIGRLIDYEEKYGPLAYACGKGVIYELAKALNLPVDLKEIFALKNTDKGMSLYQVAEFLKSKGVKAKVVKARLDKLMKTNQPKIILTKDNHFILMLFAKGDNISYVDPALGSYLLTSHKSVFEKRYSGYAIVLTQARELKEVSEEDSRNIFGAHCWCCPAGGPPPDGPGSENDGPLGGDGCPSGVGFPNIYVDIIPMALYIKDTDFKYRHFGIEFAIKRSYHSDSPVESIFGKGWSWNYGMTITKINDTRIDLFIHHNWVVAYNQDPNNPEVFHPGGNYPNRIYKRGDNWVLYKREEGTFWVFDSVGKLIRIEDRNGNYIEFRYNDDTVPYKPVEIVDSAGRRILFMYNDQGYVRSIVTFNGAVIRFEYDEKGRMITSVDAVGTRVDYTYDDRGFITEIHVPTGTYKVEYSGAPFWTRKGMVVSRIIYPNGSIREYYFDMNRGITVITPDNTETTYQDDVLWKVTRIYSSKGLRVKKGYHTRGFVSRIELPNNNIANFEYDNLDRLVKITYPDGTFEEFTYNDMDLLTSYRDRRGNLWTMNYDGKGNLLSLTYPDGSQTSLEYNNKGLPSKLIDRDGRTYLFSYDNYGNLKEAKFPSGRTFKYSFDISGNLVKVTDPTGSSFTFEYDLLGRLKAVKDALGNITRYEYNHKKVTSITYPDGNRKTYEYDSIDSLIKVCTGGFCYRLDRSQDGRLEGVVDYNGYYWKILRDYSGMYIAGYEDPFGSRFIFERFPDGSIKRKVFPDGSEILYTYDMGRLKEINYPDGNKLSYDYDPAGNLIRAINQNTTIELSYDAEGRVTQIRDAEGGNISASYDYLPSGRIKKLTYPSSLTTKFAYDKDGLISEIDINGRGKITFSYNQKGLVKTAKLGKGTAVEYSYDANGNILGIKVKASKNFSISYKRDNLGRIINMVSDGLLPSSLPQNFENMNALYDMASQITSAKTSEGDVKFEHDQRGNISRIIKGGENLALSYDWENRLSEARLNGEPKVKILYSPLGLKWKKLSGSLEYYYFYSPDRNLLYERIRTDGTLYEERFYIYLPGRLDRPLAMVLKKDGKLSVYYYIHNHQGSVFGGRAKM